MDRKRFFFFLLFLMGAYLVQAQNSSELVYLNQGILTYTPFKMEGQTNAVNTIPDFSHAGYMGGGVELPTNITIKATVVPEEGDDTQRIQSAIDHVESLEPNANGFRGVVLIKAGHYSLNNLLSIRASGVILRGEGQGLNGTVLHANPRVDHNVITILGSGGIIKDASSQQVIVSDYVPVGSYTFEVADASGFTVGDKIVITRTPNEQWINALGMDQETLCGGKVGCNGWTPNDYTIDHERMITAIEGNTITLNIPVVDVLETQYGGGSISKIESTKRIRHCGIENIRIQSFYDATNDEKHAWTAVKIADAEHCWVRQVTGQYLAYSTVNIEDANFITVQDCAYIDPKSIVTGGRRYSFAIQDGLGNLFQRCYAKNGRHDFVTGSRVTGPNVFLDCLAESAQSDIGPHHRWATGTLFDNILGGSTRVWNRGNSGTGHGWSGAQTMFWNLASYGGEFRVDSPLGAMNWGIGCIGTDQTGAGYWESWGANVQPRSLYIQQLQDRLGQGALEKVLIPVQQSGEIYELLATWSGRGDFSAGGFIGEIPFVRFENPNSTIDVSTWEGGNIELVATDSDGTIQNVKLLINGEPIASTSEAPYTFSGLTSTIQNLSHEVHYLQAIATDNDGNTSTTRLAIFGGDPPFIQEPEDMEEEEEERTEINLYPNPTQSEALTIKMIASGDYTLRIFDMLGREVHQITFAGRDYQFFFNNNLAQGTYILEIKEGDDLLYSEKILKL